MNQLNVPKDPETRYFPQKSLFRTPAYNAKALRRRDNRWYSHELFRLQEPVLSTYRGSDEIYRLTFLPALSYPSAIRLHRSTEGTTLITKTFDFPEEGVQPSLKATQTELYPATWDAWISELNHSDFWKMPSNKRQDLGFDGWDCILEGVRKGQYHWMHRWAPDQQSEPAYARVCNYLLELAGILA